MDSEFANEIVSECITHYHSLGKKGKPIQGKEWTLLSSIVMSSNGKRSVIAMATGTKCLGRNEMSPSGDLVNDSHAEVLTRRCLLRYLYDQISKFQRTGCSDIIVGCNEKNQYEINPDITFHFYSSHVPCGDASIIPKTGEKRKCDNIGDQMMKRKNNIQGDENDKMQTGETMNIWNGIKNDNDDCIKVFPDDSINSETLNCKSIGHDVSGNLSEITPVYNKTNIGNTLSGSCEMSPNKIKGEDVKLTKLVKSGRISSGEVSHPKSVDMVVEELEDCIGEVVDIHRTGAKCLQGEDRRLPGASYHQVGAVRTKPGRGDPTLSVSCSDKMTRWILCGLQGGLLSLLLSRPVMLTSVIIGGGGQYSEEVLRRALFSRSGLPHSVTLLHSSIVFPHSRYCAGPSARPCPSAILWARVSHKPLEVCVGGRRQGATKNCCNSGRLMICKMEILRSFLSVSSNDNHKEMSYKSLKALAEQYNNAWTQGKSALKVWTSKPSHLEDFKIDS